MRKRDEIADPSSCLNRARDDEWTFVLLGRDRAAPAAVRAWIAERLRLGKNAPDDEQILEAWQWLAAAEGEQAQAGNGGPSRATDDYLASLDFERSDDTVPCLCGGHAERVSCTPEEIARYNCGRPYPCCARAFVCRLCGTRLAGKTPAPEME